MNLFRFLKLKNNNQHKKKKLKQQIEIIQNGAQVTVSGVFNKDNYQTNELWLISRDGERSMKVSETSPTNNFKFIYNMEELVDNLPKYNGDTYDYYFKVRTPLSQLSKAKREDDRNLKIVEGNDDLYAEYFIRCGRFQSTNIQGLKYVNKADHTLINYITTKGNFSLVFNGAPESPTKLQIDTFKRKNKVFQ